MKKDNKITCFFSKSVELQGNAYITGSVRVDGKFSGHLVASGIIDLGINSQLQARVHSSKVVSAGNVQGEILAEKHILLESGGRFEGEIKTAELTIQEKVHFSGCCSILVPKDTPKVKRINLREARKAIEHRKI